MASPLGVVKQINAGDAVSIGMNAFVATAAYKDARGNGRGVASSIGSAAFDFALYEMLGPVGAGVMIAKDVLSIPATLAHEYGKVNTTISNRARKSNFGGYYNDNQTAYTMRSRGVQAMQQSKLTGYSTLGSEARSYFR